MLVNTAAVTGVVTILYSDDVFGRYENSNGDTKGEQPDFYDCLSRLRETFGM